MRFQTKMLLCLTRDHSWSLVVTLCTFRHDPLDHKKIALLSLLNFVVYFFNNAC